MLPCFEQLLKCYDVSRGLAPDGTKLRATFFPGRGEDDLAPSIEPLPE